MVAGFFYLLTFSPFHFFTSIGFFLYVFRENPFCVCGIMLIFAPLNN